MVNLYLEYKESGFKKSYFIEQNNKDFVINDNTECKFVLETEEQNYDLYVGSLKLSCIRNGNKIIFFNNANDIDLRQKEYFSLIFLNHYGFVSIELWQNNKIVETVEFFLWNVKIKDDINEWIKSISDVFPICRFVPLISPMTSISGSLSTKGLFFSLSSFIAELLNFIDDQIAKLNTTNFLKYDYEKNSQNISYNIVHQAKPEYWVSGRVGWKSSRANRNSVVKLGNISFEPIKYLGFDLEKNYNNAINAQYFYMLYLLNIKITGYLNSIVKIDVNSLNIRNQFDNDLKKHNVISFHQNKLILLKNNISKILYKLEKMGIKKTPKLISLDPRYRDLSLSIKALDQYNNLFKNFDSLSQKMLGIPSLDLLFEYFCFAKITEALIKNSFEVSDISTEHAIPFYIKLLRKFDNTEISIFYDQLIPKSNRNYFFHPLIDSNIHGEPKRPDFVFHLRRNNFDTSFIIDAKFKFLKKCKADHFTKINHNNLVSKYGSGIRQLNKFGLAPIFIGAICLNDETDKASKFTSTLFDDNTFDGIIPSAQQVGILSLGYSDDTILVKFFDKIFQLHDELSKTQTIKNQIPLSIPKPDVNNFKNVRYTDSDEINNDETDIIYTSHHTAPSLTDIDAAEIKGMLSRGDKPQDIAFYFGVNNGRISEIKSGIKFNFVAAKKDNLPPAGPYPPLRELLKQKNH